MLGASSDLALAVIAASEAATLLLDGALTIIIASASFSRLFELDPLTLPGQNFLSCGSGEWRTPELAAVLDHTRNGSDRAVETELKRSGKPPVRIRVSVRKLDYAGDDVRLLVTVTDLTEARSRERSNVDLLRERTFLLEELQHRTANSLQIIASILMQSAKRVASEETRQHLYNAHNRVMSVATVQRHLAATRSGTVAVRPYLTDLSASIGAAMIRDQDRIRIIVDADDHEVGAETSLSLGLIATELLINALKHAFPKRMRGEIRVEYRWAAPAWVLSVRDNGVGRPDDPEQGKAGLGTSIIEAIATQLGAHVERGNARPGTVVSVIHG